MTELLLSHLPNVNVERQLSILLFFKNVILAVKLRRIESPHIIRLILSVVLNVISQGGSFEDIYDYQVSFSAMKCLSSFVEYGGKDILNDCYEYVVNNVSSDQLKLVISALSVIQTMVQHQEPEINHFIAA
jgi:hypothetical protein